MIEHPPPQQNPLPSPPRPARLAMPVARPYATYSLVGLTALFYLLQFLGPYLTNSQFLSSLGIQIPWLPAQGADLLTSLGIKYNDWIRLGQVWRLVTPVFLHGSLLHVGFNMYALFLYGRGLESRFGHVRFLLLYFLSSFAGNVMSFLLTPQPSLGASTAIFGLLAAEGVFLVQNRAMLGGRANRALMNLLYVAGINLLFGFTTQGVDNWGHVGGLLGGLIFTWFGGPRWKVEGLYPTVNLVDERQGHGAIAGTAAVLLFFIPLAAMGWIWPIG